MIIDPLTLTEEQKDLIKKEYKFCKKNLVRNSTGGKLCYPSLIYEYFSGRCTELTYLFGKEFFEDESEK